MKFRYLPIALCLCIGSIFSQRKIDSLKVTKLNEIIVIGAAQHNPQTIKKAIYDVTVIRGKKIERLAASSIEEVLKQSLNLTITPDTSTGKNTISLFGLDGQYVKILIDNIPLTNDIGYGNNADLSQINLQDVEQIEIVEGAMAVEYGANAVTGVINIVTKNKSFKNLTGSVSIIEETVGNEFAFFDKGKHIQSANIKTNITEEIYTSVSFNKNDFKGYFNKRKGKLYHGNEDLRGHEWFPRKQYNTNLVLSYNPKQWKVFYKFSHMYDNIEQTNKSFKVNYLPTFNITKPVAKDRTFKTNRFYHNLNIIKKLKDKSNLSVNLALQIQERRRKDYLFYIKEQREEDPTSKIESQMKVLTSVGSYNFQKINEKIKGKTGYDIGLKRALLTNLSYANKSKNLQQKKLNHYDFYNFTEYSISKKTSIRAGIRLMFSELFPTKIAYNLSSKYSNENGWKYRFVAGSSPRNPNLNELYYSFVDPNHNVVGNPDLKAEDAISFNTNIKKTFILNENIYNQIKISGKYLDVKNRITWVNKSIPNERNVFTPVNIDEYKSWGISFNEKLTYRELEFNIGAIYLGTNQNIRIKRWSDRYFYNLQLNSNINYILKKHQLVLSAYYKYNGKLSGFVYKGDELVIGEQDAFNWLDLSATKNLFNKKLQIVLGVRNLTNTTQINSTIQETVTHNSTPITTVLGYGTSYFGKIRYIIL